MTKYKITSPETFRQTRQVCSFLEQLCKDNNIKFKSRKSADRWTLTFENYGIDLEFGCLSLYLEEGYKIKNPVVEQWDAAHEVVVGNFYPEVSTRLKNACPTCDCEENSVLEKSQKLAKEIWETSMEDGYNS